MDSRICRIASALALMAALASAGVATAMIVPELAVSGRARSADGVEIAYTDQGSGTLAIVFVHGGVAVRGGSANTLPPARGRSDGASAAGIRGVRPRGVRR